MWQDPFTLIISLSKEGTATGKLYLDDGEGYGYEKGEYVLRQFDFSGKTLKSTSTPRPVPSVAASGSNIETYNPTGNAWAQAIAHVKVERIVVLGLKAEPKSVTVGGQVAVEYTFEKGLSSDSKKTGMGSRLVVKSPGVSVVEDWEIVFA
jgi:alpha 1,3-glucosidase